MKAKVIAVDLDGVLCEGKYWVGDGKKIKPIKENIKKVNKLYLTNFIVIWTARRYCQAENTMNWLRENGVHYHAIHFEKMAADIYCDDKAINSKNLKSFI